MELGMRNIWVYLMFFFIIPAVCLIWLGLSAGQYMLVTLGFVMAVGALAGWVWDRKS